MRLASRALYNQRAELARIAPRLKALREAVGHDHDLSAGQWVHLYAFALEFKPDLIIELGRAYGNSTCVFTEAAHALPGCRVISYCLTQDWARYTVSKLSGVVSSDWFRPLDAREQEITSVDFGATCEDAERVLVFWDAHGFAVADRVLTNLLPAIADRPHVVAMHDVLDTRYRDVSPSYLGLPFWRGQEESWRDACARLRLGWIDTAVEQVIPALDFTTRNGIELHSADHDISSDLLSQPDRRRLIQNELPDDFFSKPVDWAYFTLNESPNPPVFAAPLGNTRLGSSATLGRDHFRVGQLLNHDLGRYNAWGRPSPLTWLLVSAKTALGRYS